MRGLLVGFLVVAVVAAGCGDDDDDGSAGPDVAATTATADFDVVFDGGQCTVTGPESVPPGEYAFVLTNTSEIDGVNVVIDVYADGRTYADSESYLEEAGGDGANSPRPDWAQPAMRDFAASALDLEDNQTQYDHILTAGPHGIMVVSGAGVWGCAGLDVR